MVIKKNMAAITKVCNSCLNVDTKQDKAPCNSCINVLVDEFDYTNWNSKR